MKERRELPTQRLRAVTDELVEDPGPRGLPGRRPPAVDADVDDDHDDELETAPSVSSPAPRGEHGPARLGRRLTPAARPAAGRPGWPTPAWGWPPRSGHPVMVYKYIASREPPPITVQVIVPSPTTVYRFWDATAQGRADRGARLRLRQRRQGGRDGAPPGTRFAAGDVLAMLESGKQFRADLDHNRERLGYYEQMRDTMTQQNNRPRSARPS